MSENLNDWENSDKYEGNDNLVKAAYEDPETIDFDENWVGDFKVGSVKTDLKKSMIDYHFPSFFQT